MTSETGVDTDALEAIRANYSLTDEQRQIVDHVERVAREVLHPLQARMDEEERCGLIFRDGLSLAAHTTDISGRGVGMSAVREAVAEANGTIHIETMVGRGTTFTLCIPRAA